MICSCVVTSSPVVGSSSTTQIGLAGQRHGDADALLLAARQLVRIASGDARRIRQPDQREELDDARTAVGGARPAPSWSCSTSATWRPTRMPGLSAVVGFCGTKLMRLPRSRSSAGAVEPSRSRALETARCRLRPAGWAGGSPAAARPAVDLPQPDSPTRPKTSPRRDRETDLVSTRSQPPALAVGDVELDHLERRAAGSLTGRRA